MTNYYTHIQEKRHITVNTNEYDDWLDKLLQFDTENIPQEHLWVDCDLYYLFLAKQGSDLWKKARVGRVTGSVLANACASGKYSNTNQMIVTQDKINKPMIDLNIVSDEINGIKVKEFNEFATKCMAHGNKTEPLIREYHSKTIEKDIIELPIAIPKYNLNLGVSIDAYVKYTNVIGEYKAPQKLYDSLLNRLNQDVKYEGYDHIIPDHYYQMHFGMNIFNKQFCDYVVYDIVKYNKVYLERIPYNSEFWENDLYPKLTHFIHNYLLPKRPENTLMLPPRQV